VGNILPRHWQLDGIASRHALSHLYEKTRDAFLGDLNQQQDAVLGTPQFTASQGEKFTRNGEMGTMGNGGRDGERCRNVTNCYEKEERCELTEIGGLIGGAEIGGFSEPWKRRSLRLQAMRRGHAAKSVARKCAVSG
jgi:hypothetical protein